MGADKEAEGIEREMDETVRAMRALGPCLEGSMKMNAKARYVKKDGTVSEYPTAPILQYRAGPKVRRYRRVPRDKIDEILRLLENGRRYRDLASRYERLSTRLALLFKKKPDPAAPRDRPRESGRGSARPASRRGRVRPGGASGGPRPA